MLEKILLAFVPVFFAIDAIGILPIFAGMTRNVFIEKRRKIVNQAVLTGFLISLSFIYFGKGIFRFLGITIEDFKIAGGILLLIFGITDLLFTQKAQRTDDLDENIGVVPIGMPLIIGPGVLTSLLLSVGTNGYNATLIGLVLNLFIVWVVFRYSDQVIKVIGEAGAIAVGKVFSLLLTAIAVMMIRLGIIETLAILKAQP